MKYYKITYSNNLKVVGKIPQSEECLMGDIQQDFIPSEGKINFDFKLPEPNLHKRAKRTSLINVTAIPPYFLVIDDDLLNLIKKFNIGNYQEWKINTWHDRKEIIDKYNLFLINDTKQNKYVDFLNSEFLIGKPGDWSKANLREPIIIKDYSDYLSLKNKFRQSRERFKLRYNKILIDLSEATEDIIRFNNISLNGYFISEKLKNSLEKKSFTGLDFIELSSLDKIEVLY